MSHSDLTTMTRTELYNASRRQTTTVRKALAAIATLTKRAEKARERVEFYRQRSEVVQGSSRRNTLERMETWEYNVLAYQQEIVCATEQHVHHVRRLEEIQARREELRLAPKPRRGKALEEKGADEVKEAREEEEEEPLRLAPHTFFVHLLSGEVQSVIVDMVQPVYCFAQEFVRQNRYHPSAVHRMSFFFPPSEEQEQEEQIVQMEVDVSEEKGVLLQMKVVVPEKEVAPVPFWTPAHRHVGRTFRNLFPQDSDVPLLHLFIGPSNPSTRMEKVELLRRILIEEGKYNMYEDGELFSMYDGWYLTHRPFKGDNRYKAMKAFVAAYPEKFWYMNEQEVEQSVAWNTEWKKVLRFKKFVVQEALSASISQQTSLEFAEQRKTVRDIVSRHLTMGEWGLQQLQGSGNHFRWFMTTHELVQLGVPPTILCTCGVDHCFVCTFSSWMARAGEFYIPPIPEKDPSVALARMIAP